MMKFQIHKKLKNLILKINMLVFYKKLSIKINLLNITNEYWVGTKYVKKDAQISSMA